MCRSRNGKTEIVPKEEGSWQFVQKNREGRIHRSEKSAVSQEGSNVPWLQVDGQRIRIKIDKSWQQTQWRAPFATY